ncbi:GHKL domain-containing protein [candidate division GN15 bacterium]|nr:GHKL domain-containing protein [candidate division GN15 bacterium]
MQGDGISIAPRRVAFELLRLLVLVCAVLVLATDASANMRRFEIRDHRDTAYLPLSLDIVKSSNLGDEHPTTTHRAAMFVPADEPGGPVMIDVGNSSMYSDWPAIFGRHPRDLSTYIDEDPIHLTICDFDVYDDSQTGMRGVVAGTYARDTAWFIRFFPDEEKPPDKILLGTGADTTGDRIWRPHMYLLEVIDYDLDGYSEAFLYLSTTREIGPRALYCIEVETMRLEWELPVASELSRQRYSNFCVSRDSAEPRVLFVTHAPLQGRVDENYNDRYRYCSVVDSSGNLIYNRVIMYQLEAAFLIQHPDVDQYWLNHVQPLDSHDSVKTEHFMFISRLDRNGAVMETIPFDTGIAHMYFAPFDHPGSPCLFVHDRTGTVHVYDTSFTLLAQSNPCRIGTYGGTIPIQGYDSVLVFSDGLYTRDFERIAAGHINPGAFWPLAFDSAGHVEMLLTTSVNSLTVYRIVAKPWWSLLDTFYVRNKVYILAALSALLVGLVLVNYYRRRTRRNLEIISQQKTELERVHRKLKEAQAQIIAQEKYQQARDIAGGFAHEIRNALFPARSAITKLKSLATKGDLSSERLLKLSRLSDDAISRAVDMTRMITDYTKLEQAKSHEPSAVNSCIAEVVARFRDRIEAQGADVTWPEEPATRVSIKAEHLEIILTNLLLNALDALQETAPEAPKVEFGWQVHQELATITVSDNGGGIAPDHADRIFDMFYSTRPETGTGLGLTVSRRIAQLYDGDLRLAHTDSHGTRFELKLSKYGV